MQGILFNKLQERKANIMAGFVTGSQLQKSNSAGEGSKGGKVVGHTKSGKPIYGDKSAKHKSYSEFSATDHSDAAVVHRKNDNHDLADQHLKEKEAMIEHHLDTETTTKLEKRAKDKK